MDARRVVVIGAGIGGLAAALRLAAAGLEVTVVERAAGPGGKMRAVSVGGSRFDAGPTVFTMKWVFEGLFEAAGLTLDDHIRLRPAATLARHAWQDGARLDLFADRERSAEAIAAFAGAREARNYLRFCDDSAAVFRLLKDSFLCQPRPNLGRLVRAFGRAGFASVGRLQPFGTLWRALSRQFDDPRLQQLFGRYATYCGSSPFEAPATLMLVAHVEQDGVWYVEGGMHALAGGFAALIERQGGRLRYERQVEEIQVEGGRVTGVRLQDGEHLAADAVIMNGDCAALAAGLLGQAVRSAVALRARATRSLSAVTWLLEARASGFPLLRHNVFFSRDYAREFRELFRQRRLPGEPTVYVCAQDRGDEPKAGAGGEERLFCLVNAPAVGDRGGPEKAEIEACENQTFSLLRRCGLAIERDPDRSLVTTPQDFHRLFPATGGALYGRVSHGWKASLQRPGCRTAIPGLYLAGGSVHPAPGVPMAALSGLMAAESLVADRASIRRFRRAATSGGI
ncbi:MAG TPA: phytoene desaturase [Kiloniellaceae bacterium]|nr:phytoene desaturase [Kiloniellaceae bacterium]